MTLEATYGSDPPGDDAFVVDFKPGTMISDAVSNRVYKKPVAGSNPLDDAVATARRFQKPESHARSMSLAVLVVLTLLALVLGICLFFGVRRWQKSK